LSTSAPTATATACPKCGRAAEKIESLAYAWWCRACNDGFVVPTARRPATGTDDEPARAWKPGDTVVLRSGSPLMTVVDVGRHVGLVFCRWADSEGVLDYAIFTAECLIEQRSGLGFVQG